MIWLKREFQDAEYGPYQDRLDALAIADATRIGEYLMVSTETDISNSDYYVGLPDEKLIRLFDGFTRVNESDLPKEIDAFHIGVQGKEFHRLFRFKDGEP
jgi:hypothetical protein